MTPDAGKSSARKGRRIAWRLPPRWVRRVFFAPLLVALAFVWLPFAIWGAVIIAGVVAWALPGRLRILRVFFMMGLYLLWDAGALVVMFALWIASGFGYAMKRPRFQLAHYRLAGAMLGSLFWAARWLLRLEIEVEDDEANLHAHGQPSIVASRHAGPADSFIIVSTLINRYHRAPAIVLKDTLQWDPAVDVLLNRLPTRFVTPTRQGKGAVGGAAAIGELAAGLQGDAALLIFPEGGNVTPRRRERRIAQLRKAGHTELAERAEAMGHVMPPHAGGMLSAMAAAPQAEVIMLAHTGLERLATVGDVWRELPVDKKIVLKSWTADPAEVPAELRAREDWLYGWWEKIDGWIDENQPPATNSIKASGKPKPQENSALTDSPE